MPALALLLATSLLQASQLPQPAATDGDRVRAFLERSSQRLYRADEAGLAQLSFRIPFELPRAMLEPVFLQAGSGLPPGLGDPILFGDLTVTWSAATGASVQFRQAEGLPDPLGGLVGQLEPEYQGRALTALNMALSHNADVEPLLEDFHASLKEDPQGLDEVTFTPKESGEPFPIRKLVWYFDSDGVPVKTMMVSDQPSPTGAPTTVTRTQTNSWRRASADDDRLVLDWAHTLQDGGSLGTATSEISFEYAVFDGIVLLTGFTESSEAPDASFVSEVHLQDIQVVRGAEDPAR